MRTVGFACLLFSVAAYADTVEMIDTGAKQQGVYVAENSLYFVVIDPKTGKSTSIQKNKAKVTLSSDHLALGAKWRPATKVETKTSGGKAANSTDKASGEDKDNGVITIKHIGSYKPDPSSNRHIATQSHPAVTKPAPAAPKKTSGTTAQIQADNARKRQAEQQKQGGQIARQRVAAQKATLRAERTALRRSGRIAIR